MEAIQDITHESARKQIELVSPASSTSNTQNSSADNSKSLKKESQIADRVKEATNEKINRIAEAMDSYVRSVQRDLNIRVHEGTGDIIVRVTSQESGKVIREIPPKELLDLAARMEEMAGTLFDQKV